MTAAPASIADVFSSALRGEACHIVGLEPVPVRLPVATWSSRADTDDVALLAHCVGPTLDIGCGPGRMTQHLAELGHPVLGIDVVAEAVAQTRARGVAALQRDVFDPLPGESQWGTALLADGNIGIGGDPRALLTRAGTLVRPGGLVVVDLAAPGAGVRTRTVRIQTRLRRSRPFPWSVVGADAIGAVSTGTGLVVLGLHRQDDRWFAVLTKGA